MSDLFFLQTKFQHYLLLSDNNIADDIVETEKVSTEVRLGIYNNAYRSRLIEAFAANYPVIQIYLGHEQFETLANEYIDRYPSHYRSIRWFGDRLELFLQENEPYKNHSYLSELANVEWVMTLVFDAHDSDVATLDTLNRIPPESWIDMRLIPHPSMHLIQSSWNTIPVWDAITREESPDEISKNAAPITWIFWRNDLINYFYSLTNDEACAIKALCKELTFGDICEALCEWIDENEVAVRAASLLKGWITSGLIAEIKY